MAEVSHDAVNLRLYCCRLQLDYYQQLLDQAELPLTVIQHLAGEAAVYHLRSGYQAYLAELSQLYLNIKANYSSAQVLADVFKANAVASAELLELCSLEQAEHDWLSPILLYSAEANSSLLNRSSPQQMIPVQQMSDTKLEHSSLNHAFHSLQALINRHRSLSQEW